MKSKEKVLSSMLWRFAERCGAQGVQLIVSIILARMLMPEDYGVVALLTVFISIASVFVDSGFGTALVQRKNVDEVDFSTVFIFNVFISVVMYAVMFFAAPFIAEFYNQPLLTSVVRAMSISLLIGGVKGVQQAHLSRNLRFKRFFVANMTGTIISAFVGIMMAYKGAGAWALVAQNLTSEFIGTFILWVTSSWRPRLVFCFKRLKSIFSYGGKMLCSGLLDTVYNNLYSLIIGKFYSAADLGVYNKGKSYPILLVENLNSSIQSVLFPVMSSAQDNINDVKIITRKSITIATFVIFPVMALLAAGAHSFIIILLTDKWVESVYYLRLCCFIYALWPIHTANLAAIRALGRSDIFLKLEVLKKIIGVLFLVITIPFGVKIMVLGRCISSVLGSFINAFPNKKLLNYSYWEQLRDIAPAIILSVAMMIITWSVDLIGLNVYSTFFLQVVLGICVYFGGAKLFKFEQLDYIINTVKELKNRKKN